MRTLLLGNAHAVSWNPKQWWRINDGRVLVGILFDFRFVSNVAGVLWYQFSHGGIISVDVRAKKFLDHRWFTLRCSAKSSLVAGNFIGAHTILLLRMAIRCRR